jgi:hypothetical protein
MAQQKRARLFEHPLVYGSFRNWMKLLWDNKDIDAKYLPRAVVVMLSTLFMSPLRLYESARYSRIVKSTQVHPSPIFIIGHWRTGTTHLHNLLCQDESNGYVSTFQAFAPGLSLTGDRTIKRAFNKIAQKMHPTREIDNIPLSLDSPEEEDLAVACMSPYSYLHMYTFPRRARHYFEGYITNFDDLPDSVLAKWKKVYLLTLRKATLAAEGRRLVIKNCADSARLKTLLKIFPDAKFIHIHRNPYDVFRSTRHLYWTVLQRSQLQEISRDELEVLALEFYVQLMQRLLQDKALIPKGNLVEVRFEDLEKQPVAELRRIYETLSLPGFPEAESRFQRYLDSIAGYKKLAYAPDDSLVAKVNEHWGFVFDQLGYERLEPAGARRTDSGQVEGATA